MLQQLNSKNSFTCGGVAGFTAEQAAHFVQNGELVQIVQGNAVVGTAWYEWEDGTPRYILRSPRTGDHTLSAPHTDHSRLAAHMAGFAALTPSKR